MKKGTLTKAIIVSVILVNLVAWGFKLTGKISDGIGQAPIGTFIRAWHDGSLAKAMRGESDSDSASSWRNVTPTDSTETTSTAKSTSVQKDSTEAVETASAVSKDSTETVETVEDTTTKTYAFQRVDDSYFSDACLIGDSRAACVEYWDGLPGMTYHTVAGYSIYEALEKSWCDVGGWTDTLEMALSNEYDCFTKVYVEFGINGAITDTIEEWITANKQMINLIQYTQPHAIIFLCSILAVTTDFDEASGQGITNAMVYEHNDALQTLADNINVF